MALLLHSGASSTDLGVAGTIRADISDYLAACLVLANNVAGFTKVGPEFADTIAQWDEDRLNNDFVTDTQAGGLVNQAAGAQGTIVVSLADAAILVVGTVLSDQAAGLGGVALSEQLQVNSISGQNIGVIRGFAGTTPSAHAQGAVYQMVSRPTYENSDLGADMSRARIRKYNYLHRHEINVNLSAEVIMRSKRGYTPGIQDELEYQFFNRTQEILRLWNKATLYSRPQAGTTGTSGQSGGDYSTMAGFVAWLDGTWNATSTLLNFSTSGFAPGQLDLAINAANKTTFRNGAYDDWALGGANFAEDVGKLYSDRIRIQQDDMTRGFAAQFFRTSLVNELRLLMDGFVQDTTPAGIGFVLDSGRIRYRPLADQFYYVITAETFRDGDAVRALSKLSLEMRNTGSDSGQAHQLITNISF